MRILNTLPDGTRIYLKPTASSEGAPLWVRRSHTLLVPRSGTYVLSLISSWICQSRFAELFVEGVVRTHSCAASQLAVGF